MLDEVIGLKRKKVGLDCVGASDGGWGGIEVEKAGSKSRPRPVGVRVQVHSYGTHSECGGASRLVQKPSSRAIWRLSQVA